MWVVWLEPAVGMEVKNMLKLNNYRKMMRSSVNDCIFFRYEFEGHICIGIEGPDCYMYFSMRYTMKSLL